ncbi:efflux transporter outer membrane subunit [Flavobacterium rakeshii]|uniref:Efflux transporter outer membrane subunit n=1 Tax=Flavobacterium rakeshii TaxID=1038845 RepID=A0A6N8HII6_9FLAO|nr:efflux transporter outer membrane subunit [Flavobacterium rakeshii]MUV05500.1 efflux transporter outer membrane subunit [Flavobacterium rakeshii]
MKKKSFKIYRVIILVGAGLLMQSCLVAKKYERPDVKAENLYRTEVIAQDSTSLGDVAWDKIFTDPVLQGHIKKGLQNNFDMLVAIQNVTAAEAYLNQAKMGYFPTLSGTANLTHQELSKNSQFGSFFNGALDQYQLSANLSWEADVWGKIRSNKRAYGASYMQTIAANQAVKTRVITDIAATYYQLVGLDAQLKVAEETLINRNESVDAILALKEAGSVNEVAVQQTEAQKYATELIIEDLKTNITLVENAMSLLLGEAPHEIERSPFNPDDLNPEIKLGYSTSLLSNRPDVVAAEYNLINKFELTNVARANFYPQFTITATGGLQSLEVDKWFNANSLFANIVGGLTQPIFNQRQIRTQHEVAKANQQQAYIQFQQALVNAGKEVSDALAQYNNETKKLDIRLKQVESLRKASDYSDELLEYGLVNYLESLTAKYSALSAELDLVNNKYQQYLAIINLYKALGGGWK